MPALEASGSFSVCDGTAGRMKVFEPDGGPLSIVITVK
jgi:hypothetical protein